MIIYHIEYNKYGLIDIDGCYVDVDTSFVESEDAEVASIVRSEPQ